MINIIDKSKCSGCYACAEICPQKCIDMISDAEGFWYPSVNEAKCVNCNLCEKVCPIAATTNKSLEKKPIAAYAAIYNEELIRFNSSSGGVFSALSAYVLEKGGVVFGAGFDENFNVIHKYIEKVDEMNCLRGSKYVQSRIGNAFQQAESFLKSGRLVLFSGTPCQIEGLLSYLKKPYDNLITQDLICHGVPSPMVWQKYIQYRALEANDTPIQKISFRSKITGWRGYSMFFTFENGETYQATRYQDPMMQAFLSNLCLRPSCYACHFKTKSRKSDITLADFWGIQHILPDIDDDKGVSLVIIQSKTGEKVFEEIRNSIDATEVDVDVAISYNSSMTKSVTIPKNRAAFLKKISAEKFLVVQRKCCKVSLKSRIKAKISKWIKSHPKQKQHK